MGPQAPLRGAGNCATSPHGELEAPLMGPQAPPRGAGNCATSHDGAAGTQHPHTARTSPSKCTRPPLPLPPRNSKLPKPSAP